MAMNSVETINGVETALGVVEGLAFSTTAASLTLTVAAGKARVGTVQDDASIENKAAYGLNQPGKVIKTAQLTIAVPANSTGANARLVWLTPAGALALSLVPANGQNPADVAPAGCLGPDMNRGRLLDADQNGNLHPRPLAGVILGKVTSNGTDITLADDTYRQLVNNLRGPNY